MRIRKAEISDLIRINSFLIDMNMLPFDEKRMLDDYRYIYLLERENIIIGCLSFIILSNEAELESIYIDSIERKKGNGKILMDKLIDECKKKSCEKIFLEVRQSNSQAIKLYQDYNFNTIHCRKKYYGNEDGLVMTKELR